MTAKPIRKPYVQPANDSGIEQGRRQDAPNEASLIVIALVVVPWALACLAVWAWVTLQ